MRRRPYFCFQGLKTVFFTFPAKASFGNSDNSERLKLPFSCVFR